MTSTKDHAFLPGWSSMDGQITISGTKPLFFSLESQYPVSLRTRDPIEGENKVNFMIVLHESFLALGDHSFLGLIPQGEARGNLTLNMWARHP